jgi:hypothetical protein
MCFSLNPGLTGQPEAFGPFVLGKHVVFLLGDRGQIIMAAEDENLAFAANATAVADVFEVYAESLPGILNRFTGSGDASDIEWLKRNGICV